MLEDHPVDLDRSFAPSLGFMTRGEDKHPVFAVVTSVRPLGEPENASVEHLPADLLTAAVARLADRSLPIDLFPRNTLRRSASPPHSFARPTLRTFLEPVIPGRGTEN